MSMHKKAEITHCACIYIGQGCRKVQKSGGASSNVVGIISPHCTVGLTNLPKTGGRSEPQPPYPRIRHLCRGNRKDEKNPAWHARAAVALEQERPEEGQTGASFVDFFS